jgi:hypothetical protein
VVLNVDDGSFLNPREFSSEQNYKNIAYVTSQTGWNSILAPGTIPDPVSGFERRVMAVNLEIPDDYTGSVTSYRTQAGRDELHKRRRTNLFDGEVNQRSAYIYETDYNLGDLVEVRNKDGVISNRRVFEQIFVSDVNGDRSYPTLGTGQLMTEATWLGLSADVTTWSELTTEVWADA